MDLPALTASGGMRIAHVLRKYHPAEWGGTETAVQRLFADLRGLGVESVVFCPRIRNAPTGDPLSDTGCAVKRFHSFLPIVGISQTERRRHIAVGGNLMSLDLPLSLLREPDISAIHSHALGRLGGIASLVAQQRGVPLVVTIHGGYFDLSDALKASNGRSKNGWEWGKVFGFMLRSRQLFRRADAILTCNPQEAALASEQFPGKRVVVQPHGVSMNLHRHDCRDAALEAFPWLRKSELLLCVGRIDAVKNQHWLVEQAPPIFDRHPGAVLVFAGACTNDAYGDAIRARISQLGLEKRIFLTGGLPSGDERLIGLFQLARAVVLPSISETFGLVILEAWASGSAVIASRTSGAMALIREDENGWLFSHGDSPAFHEAVDAAMLKPEVAARFADAGNRLVGAEYDNAALAKRMNDLYCELIEEKHALHHSA